MILADFYVKFNENGRKMGISSCVCQMCDNTFFIPEIGENEPNYCPYCGVKFTHYEDKNGKKKNLAGTPI